MAFDAKLGGVFGFEEADLAANRDGRLTDEQELGFKNTAAWMRRRTPRVKMMLTIVFAGAIALVGYGISVTPGGGTTAGIVAAVILAWILGIVFFFMGRNSRHQSALDRRELLTVEGPVSFAPVAFDEGVGGATYHVLVEGKKTFTVFADQMDAMTDGARYRFHYMDLGIARAPLSLERIEG